MRRGQRGLDDVRLGGELGEVPVERRAGLVDQVGVLGLGGLSGGVSLAADPAARVGQGLVEFLAFDQFQAVSAF